MLKGCSALLNVEMVLRGSSRTTASLESCCQTPLWYPVPCSGCFCGCSNADPYSWFLCHKLYFIQRFCLCLWQRAELLTLCCGVSSKGFSPIHLWPAQMWEPIPYHESSSCTWKPIPSLRAHPLPRSPSHPWEPIPSLGALPTGSAGCTQIFPNFCLSPETSAGSETLEDSLFCHVGNGVGYRADCR